MTTKNMLGGALINYGATLPATGTSPDGALFLKTDGGGEGLYIYRLISDTSPMVIGNQAGAAWSMIAATGVGIDADTLDGIDSTGFQLASTELSAFAAMAGTGIVVKTAANTYAAKSVAAGSSKLTVTNGSGTGVGNISLDVAEANLVLNNIGGTLGLAKGGTNSSSTPPAGSVIFSNGSALVNTAVGIAPVGSGFAQVHQVLVSNGTGTPTWTNTSAINVQYAVNAGTAATAAVAADAQLLDGLDTDINATANTVPIRDGTADLRARLFRSTFADQATISGGLVFRINNGLDNFLRICNDLPAIRTFLDVPTRAGGSATGTWGISVTGNSATATTLQTPRDFNVTGPTANATWLTTEASVAFNGSGNVTLRVNGINASLLTAGVVPNARISGAYSNFTTITASGNIAADTVTVGAVSVPASGGLNTAGAIQAFGNISSSGNITANGGNLVTTLRVRSGDGTAALPAFSFTSDTGNGMFLSATDTLGWSTDGVQRLTLNASGDLTATGNVTAYSDRRLKENISPLTGAIEKVLALSGVTFNRKGLQRREVGVIAQEVEAVLPEAVFNDAEGFKSVAYGNLVGLLIEAIKDQQRHIDALRRQVEALQG